MTQYHVHTVRCPNCSRWFNFTRLSMYSGFAAASTTNYTDFFNEAAPSNSALLGCPHCSTAYWSKDLPISSTYGLGEFRGKSPSASPIYGTKLVELLKQNFWKTQEEELFLRVMAWWWLNMPYRKAAEGEATAADIDGRLHENLTELLPLVEADTTSRAIMRAEILREIGRFQECIDVLDQLIESKATDVNDTGNRLAISIISDNAKNNVTRVQSFVVPVASQDLVRINVLVR